MFAEARRPEGAASAVAHDDGVILAGGLKTAAKCRACARTLDVGAPAWFNKDGALGKKITCDECHARKLEPVDGQEAIAEAETKKKAPKRKRVIPKLEPEMLLDREKGLPSVYKAFPKLKFKGKGHEASDLRKLLNKYSEWGHTLLPDMATSEFFLRLEKLGGNHRVRAMVDNIRNVQQGLCTLDEIYDYDLAERVAPEAEEAAAAATAGDENVGWEDEDEMADLPMGAHDEMAGWEDADEMVDLPPPVEVTEEVRERIERNKQEALARAAARKGESGPAVRAEAADEEWEEMAISGDKEEWTLDAADEEAEQDFFYSAGETVMGTAAPVTSVLPEYIVGGGISSDELAKRRRLEVAAAEAAALEAGLDDPEEADLIVSCGGVEETQPLPEHAVPEPMVPEETQPLAEDALPEPMFPEETQPLSEQAAPEPIVPEETQALPGQADEEPMVPEETQALPGQADEEPMVPQETQALPGQADEEPMVPEETQPLVEQADEEPMVPEETQPLVEQAQELEETQALA